MGLWFVGQGGINQEQLSEDKIPTPTLLGGNSWRAMGGELSRGESVVGNFVAVKFTG